MRFAAHFVTNGLFLSKTGSTKIWAINFLFFDGSIDSLRSWSDWVRKPCKLSIGFNQLHHTTSATVLSKQWWKITDTTLPYRRIIITHILFWWFHWDIWISTAIARCREDEVCRYARPGLTKWIRMMEMRTKEMIVLVRKFHSVYSVLFFIPTITIEKNV